ncbi:CotH kinase family protein [Pleionea sediminis]|uniref:CotH kinase family protein n=1 Tax=Pleionea sediminis TaxID=2569479 RepID=UPI001185FB07|nr:CotH kinase family protein [Pleionea sediminis]
MNMYQILKALSSITKIIILIPSITVLLAGCTEGESSQATGQNLGGDGDVFEKDRLLNIEIFMSEKNFSELKSEGRTLASASRDCVPEFEYTEFKAKVVIDGVTVPKVTVRKKGFLGSLSPTRPSLKIDFDDRVSGQTYQNRKRMTLNNNRQDVSNARQCLSYAMFDAAGIKAPRCNFARVTVNGEDFGVYTHVEPIKKPFLERAFGNDEGNLYEAQLADFGEYLNDKFEKKTNERENDRSDLTRISNLFSLSNEAFVEEVEQVIDIDEFISFWAIETLIGHWDSASGNANNFYIYFSPIDNKFHFIPWGADASFSPIHFTRPGTGPVYRNFRLAERLYSIEMYRNQYIQTLTEFMNLYWDEEALTLEAKRIAQLTNTPTENLETLLRFINGSDVSTDDASVSISQRERLNLAITGQDIGSEPELLKDEPLNCEAPVKYNLTAHAVANNGTDTGEFRFTLPSGHQVNASINLASLNVDSIVIQKEQLTNPAVMSILMIGADSNDFYKPYVLQAFIEEPQFIEGTHKFHAFANNIILFEVDESLPMGVKTIALGGTGEFIIESVFIGENQTDINLHIDGNIEFNENVSE